MACCFHSTLTIYEEEFRTSVMSWVNRNILVISHKQVGKVKVEGQRQQTLSSLSQGLASRIPGASVNNKVMEKKWKDKHFLTREKEKLSFSHENQT